MALRTGQQLRASLRAAGFSRSAIDAAWPDWWTDQADSSTSAQNELRFSLARKLGLDPGSLVRDEGPTFVWRDGTKYKRLTAETEFEQGALASFGTGVARALVAATPTVERGRDLSPAALREAMLIRQPFVRLPDIVSLCWSLGVPVAYLRVFPVAAKRMAAMAVHIAGRYAILISQDAKYPAPVSYYIAHELGHIALGHLEGQSALIDIGDPLRGAGENDAEEIAADRYALELLTGIPEPTVSTETRSFLAWQLAQSVGRAAGELGIEPGVLALCFGHSTGRWNKAYGALKYIYGDGTPIWRPINSVVKRTVDWSQLTPEMAQYLVAILKLDHV